MKKLAPLFAKYAKKTFLPYQKRWLADFSRWRIANKSRQVGWSFVTGFEVLAGAGLHGRNQLIVSASEDNAKIILEYVNQHMQAMGIDWIDGNSNVITFPNGAEIRVLAQNWRTGRGRAGDVYFDEFAFQIHDNEMFKAVVPSVTAVKGRVTIISTPRSRIDRFWKIWENGSEKWSRHQCTIWDAIKDGFWADVEELKELFDPDEFAQAYECIPLDDSDSFLTYNLISTCLDPGLTVSGDVATHWGLDIGRTRDSTAIMGLTPELWEEVPVQVLTSMQELKKTPFREQLQIIRKLLRNGGNMSMDKSGIGMNLHEDLCYDFGSRVKGLNFAPAVMERLAKGLKRAFEERALLLPNNPTLITHLLSVKRQGTMTGFSYKADRKQGHHGDLFWGLALALDAAQGPMLVDDIRVFAG